MDNKIISIDKRRVELLLSKINAKLADVDEHFEFAKSLLISAIKDIDDLYISLYDTSKKEQ